MSTSWQPHETVADSVSEAPARQDLGEWYEAYRPRIYRYVRWRLSGREAAEDVTAQVFMRALRRLDTYRPERASPQTWLFQIARSTVTDYLRRLKRKRGLHVSIERIHDIAAELPSPEERLLYEERVRRLLNAVAGLRPTDREVLELRYGGQMSHREVADVLGITENAAAVRVHRALHRLQEKIQKERDET